MNKHREAATPEEQLTNYRKSQQLWLRLSTALSKQDLQACLASFLQMELKDKKVLVVDHQKARNLNKTSKVVPFGAAGQVMGDIIIEGNTPLSPREEHLVHLLGHLTATSLIGISNRKHHEVRRIEQLIEHETQIFKELNLELQKAMEARSHFLSQMSHEIRTPLNAIIGLSDLLSGYAIDQEFQDKIAVINRAGNSLLHIINNILDLSKLKSGEVKVKDAAFDLAALVKEVVEMFRHNKNTKPSVVIDWDLGTGFSLHRKGDPNLLKQILVNFVGNAVKFTDKGRITVQVRLFRDKDFHIKVIDTGPGISDKEKQTIFHEYAQSSLNSNAFYQGTGLGLAITKRLTQALQGHVWVTDNDIDGAGSIFHLTIPLPESAAVAPTPTPVNIDLDLVKKELKILFVDDAPDNIMLAKLIFKKTSFDVTYANNGQEALKAAQNHPYHVIFMDIQMPRMDGVEATTMIRAWEQHQNTQVAHIVALTADAYNYSEEDLVAKGFDRKLLKPLKKEDIFSELSHFFHNLANIDKAI